MKIYCSRNSDTLALFQKLKGTDRWLKTRIWAFGFGYEDYYCWVKILDIHEDYWGSPLVTFEYVREDCRLGNLLLDYRDPIEIPRALRCTEECGNIKYFVTFIHKEILTEQEFIEYIKEHNKDY